MRSSAATARLGVAIALLGLPALLAACSSGGSAAPTVTVTVTHSASGGGSDSPAPPASSPSSSGTRAAAECATSQLRLAISNGNGAAGTIYYNLDFTNVSSAPCLLQGYPGVSLVSAPSTAGSQIGADAKRTPVSPPRPVTLSAGQTAHAQLGVAEAGNFPVSSCHPVTAHYLKVFPPDQTVAGYLKFTAQTCASTSQPTMRISPITAGA
jgi:hypothetical protein